MKTKNKNISVRNLYIVTILSLVFIIPYGCKLDFPSGLKPGKNDDQIRRMNNNISLLYNLEFQRLYGIGQTILQDQDIQHSLMSSSKSDIKKAINKYWVNILRPHAIDSYSIYDSNLNLVASSSKTSVPKELLMDIKPVSHSRGRVISCNKTCEIYAAIPHVENNKIRGILVLSVSLIDIIRNLKLIYGPEYQFALVASSEQEPTETSIYIKAWKSEVIAATSHKDTIPLLMHISNTLSLEDMLNKNHTVQDENMNDVNISASFRISSVGYGSYIIAITKQHN